jgi:hypothetical protein
MIISHLLKGPHDLVRVPGRRFEKQNVALAELFEAERREMIGNMR